MLHRFETALNAGILVVDDEKGLRDLLSYELSGRGYRVGSAATGEEALARFASKEFSLLISDVRMPGMDGLTLLDRAQQTRPDAAVVLTTGYGTIEVAVEAMKRGAYDFLLKPVDMDHLDVVVRRALRNRELKALVALYESSLTLFRSVELDEILPSIVDLTRRLLEAERALILLAEEDGLRMAADTGGPDGRDALRSVAEGMGRGLGGSPLGVALVPASAPDLAALEVGALLLQPLVSGGETLGLLLATRAPGGEPFSEQDLRQAAVFGAQAAQAVRNARLFRELGRLQGGLLRSEKLNAVGRMAAGIAHQINSPLTVILGGLELVQGDENLPERHRAELEGVAEEARRCRDVVRSLLEFASSREPKLATLDVRAVLESSLRLAALGSRRPPVVTWEWPEGALRVLADAVQFEQVLVNLMRNSIQAMEKAECSELTVSVERAEGRLSVRVADRGPGLAPEHLTRLFEPFFTTKPAGEGTGLGLYLCRLLVERQGGRITASNRPDGGAEFCLDLPSLD